jgi:hypothetical protein
VRRRGAHNRAVVDAVRIRLAGCVLLCVALLLGGVLLRSGPALESAPVPPGETGASVTSAEGAGDPRSGRLPGEHASAMLAAPNLAGSGGPVARLDGRFVQAFGVHPALFRTTGRPAPMPGRPLTIPLLI